MARLNSDQVFRMAEPKDVEKIQLVRQLVNENVLSDPELVKDKDVLHYITQKGRGWVCDVDRQLVGFSIIDLIENSVWALFVDPQFAEQGIGKELHRLMIDWYFQQTKDKIHLGTDPNTRAEKFNLLQGWHPVDSYLNGKIKLELNYEDWQKRGK